ncbi:MAG: T9SS type A sorting domain-containing protein, partial [Elusimicrobia bacterium]|nr:T9SS type A sorting domain-containing protein [Elusimicrobiota bacterium]
GMVPFNASAGTISYSGASYQDWRYLHGTKDLSSNPTTQGAVVFTVPADLPLIGSDGITAMDFVYYQYGSIEAARIRVSSGKTFTDPAPGVTAPTISCQIKRDEGGEIRHAAAQSTLVIPPTALPATAQSGEPITITMEVIELTDLTPQTSIASAAQAIGLKLGGSALRLGPAGLAFAKPVTLKMALSSSCAPTTKAGIYWWNPNLKVWQRVTDSTLNLASCEVSAPLNHFSIYALFLDPPEPSSLELGEVYVFPNPARKEQKPTFHIETQATLSSLDIRIYDATGQLLHQKTLTGNSPQVTNRAGKVALAYEYTWDSTDIASGVYFYTLKASRQGETVNHKGKFVVVR